MALRGHNRGPGRGGGITIHNSRFTIHDFITIYCHVGFFYFASFSIYLFFHTQHKHNIQNTTKQNNRHILNISRSNQKEGEREGQQEHKVTPLYNHVCPTKNTAKHQWSKAWPHQLAPLYIHMTLFAGGLRIQYVFLHMCGVN